MESNRSRHGEAVSPKPLVPSKPEPTDEKKNNYGDFDEKSDVGRDWSLSQEACHAHAY